MQLNKFTIKEDPAFLAKTAYADAYAPPATPRKPPLRILRVWDDAQLLIFALGNNDTTQAEAPAEANKPKSDTNAQERVHSCALL